MVRIKELRKARGLSQKAVAIDLKVSQATISAWESGAKKMSNSSAARVADYFMVSMDYLLGRSDSMVNEKEKPIVSDDELRAWAIDRVSALDLPGLIRVRDFLAGLEAGQDIHAAPAAAPSPGGRSSQ